MSEPAARTPLRKSGQIPARVQAARDRKREKAAALGIDDAFVANLVEAFYTSVRADPLLGPVFAKHVTDWDQHLDRLEAFWRSILFSSGEYTGNPMRAHIALPHLDGPLFCRWLELFYETLATLDPQGAATTVIGERARAIADSLLTGVRMHHSGVGGRGESAPEHDRGIHGPSVA